MANKMTGVVTMRLPAETMSQLEELAGKLDRTPSWLARQAMIVYMKKLKEKNDAAAG